MTRNIFTAGVVLTLLFNLINVSIGSSVCTDGETSPETSTPFTCSTTDIALNIATPGTDYDYIQAQWKLLPEKGSLEEVWVGLYTLDDEGEPELLNDIFADRHDLLALEQRGLVGENPWRGITFYKDDDMDDEYNTDQWYKVVVAQRYKSLSKNVTVGLYHVYYADDLFWAGNWLDGLVGTAGDLEDEALHWTDDWDDRVQNTRTNDLNVSTSLRVVQAPSAPAISQKRRLLTTTWASLKNGR